MGCRIGGGSLRYTAATLSLELSRNREFGRVLRGLARIRHSRSSPIRTVALNPGKKTCRREVRFLYWLRIMRIDAKPCNASPSYLTRFRILQTKFR